VSIITWNRIQHTLYSVCLSLCAVLGRFYIASGMCGNGRVTAGWPVVRGNAVRVECEGGTGAVCPCMWRTAEVCAVGHLTINIP
jgi:hypothetical protein